MLTKTLTFCATGHRLDKLGGYTRAAQNKLLTVAVSIVNDFVKPKETIISGMAQGWDTAIAQAAILLGRRLIAAVPFEGQETLWPEASQLLYKELLTNADEVHIVSKGTYSAIKMQKRNEWMVDRSFYSVNRT